MTTRWIATAILAGLLGSSGDSHADQRDCTFLLEPTMPDWVRELKDVRMDLAAVHGLILAYEAEMADPNPDRSIRCDCKSDKVPWDEVRAVMPDWYFSVPPSSGRQAEELRKLRKQLRSLRRDFREAHCSGT